MDEIRCDTCNHTVGEHNDDGEIDQAFGATLLDCKLCDCEEFTILPPIGY